MALTNRNLEQISMSREINPKLPYGNAFNYLHHSLAQANSKASSQTQNAEEQPGSAAQSKVNEASNEPPLRPRSLPAIGISVNLSKKKQKQKKDIGKDPQLENIASTEQSRKPTARHQHQVRALATTHNHQELVRAARNHPATSLGFMYVCSIVKSSAADQCGLKCGDIIIQFGPLNKTNWNGLRDVPPLVQENMKKVIPITVLRQSSFKRSSSKTYKRISLRAIPAEWSKGAVLGCVLNTWPPPLPVQRSNAPNHPSPLAPPFGRSHSSAQTERHFSAIPSHEYIDEMLAQDRQEAEADSRNPETFGAAATTANAPEKYQQSISRVF